MATAGLEAPPELIELPHDLILLSLPRRLARQPHAEFRGRRVAAAAEERRQGVGLGGQLEFASKRLENGAKSMKIRLERGVGGPGGT